jgi:tetratricopeptide (TPR) repeat protein
MKCPKCQTDNTDTARFCSNCAKPLTSAEDSQPSFTRTLETPVESLTRGTLFANRYEIIEKLGRGGMGRVFRVEDTKLQQEVALKLIKPEIAEDEKTIERFRNELKIARKIRHMNVCGMFDLSESGGTHFITMEYVRGEDLRSFIRRSGQLAVGTTVRIAKQICAGLSEAHKLGVVHRDLKSSNIMIDKEGDVRIMDFGIARALEERGITGAGVIIGTPEYLSPEQAEAGEVDHRSDIYSLGVIIYEMVTGQLPFEGDTPLSIAMKHKGEMPKEPKEFNPGIPDDLSLLIMKCLQKERDHRYQTADSIEFELSNIEKGITTTEIQSPEKMSITDREITVSFSVIKLLLPAALVSIVVIVGFLLWRYVFQKETLILPQGKPSIAVMDFTNKSEEEMLDFWSEGLANLVVTDLDQSRYIRTIPPYELDEISSILGIQDIKNFSSEDLEKLATRAKITYLLNGNYIKQEEVFLIEANFINTATGKISATINLEGTGEESAFSLVDSITKEAKKVLRLSPDEMETDIDEEIGKITTYSPEAYKYEREARRYAYVGESNRAIQLLERAVSLDPEYAGAYLTLSLRYDFIGNQLLENQYKQKAHELSHRLSERDRLYAFGDYSERSKRLLEIYPDDYLANLNLALSCRSNEEWDDSLKYMKVVQKYQSHRASYYESFAEVYRAKGMYSNAQEVLDFYLDNFTEDHYLLASKATNYLCQGKYNEALTELERAMSLLPDTPDDADKIGNIYRCTERKGDVYLCMGEFIKAEEIYRSLLTGFENFFRIRGRDRLALLYLLQGKMEKSKEVIKEGMKVEGLSLNGRLGYIYLQTHELKNALIEFEKALPITYDEREQMTLLCSKGRTYVELNELDNALRTAGELKELIESKLYEKATRYYEYLLGLIEVKKGNLSDGIEHLNQAMTLLPFEMGMYGVTDHALFFDAIANAYYMNGDLNNASIYYSRLSNLNTGRIYFGDIYAKSFYMLGKISEEEGDRAEAIEHFNTFLTLWKAADPGTPELEDAKERLKDLRKIG